MITIKIINRAAPSNPVIVIVYNRKIYIVISETFIICASRNSQKRVNFYFMLTLRQYTNCKTNETWMAFILTKVCSPGPADGELTVIPCKLPFLRRDGDF